MHTKVDSNYDYVAAQSAVDLIEPRKNGRDVNAEL
jgi:hypothetical protein